MNRYPPDIVVYPMANFVFAPVSIPMTEWEHMESAFIQATSQFINANPTYRVEMPPWMERDDIETDSWQSMASPEDPNPEEPDQEAPGEQTPVPSAHTPADSSSNVVIIRPTGQRSPATVLSSASPVSPLDYCGDEDEPDPHALR